MRHRLEISDAQARIMQNALEMYSRTLVGQGFGVGDQINLGYEKAKELERYLEDNIEKTPEMKAKSSIAWDLYQVVRHSVAFLAHPEGGIQVCFNTPLQMGSEKLASIEWVPETSEDELRVPEKVLKCTGQCLVVGESIVMNGVCRGCDRTVAQIIENGKSKCS